MKKFAAAILVGLAAAQPVAFASQSAAQSATYSSSRYYPEEAILGWSGERFTIIRIDSLGIRSQERLRLEAWMRSSPGRIAALQNTVLENGEFAAALRARSVQLNNVVAIQRAMNGNLVVFLR